MPRAPPAPRLVVATIPVAGSRDKTVEEVAYMRRKRITITTFMLAADAPLLEFVRKRTELNRGRIYETAPQNVGAHVFRDSVRNRRKRLH